ncbi:unnamed protein product [Candidula unifasciata]|uniref:G-protein coupled receptors family 1 profile domain-containing protein n=1 Tax=Candidula unifasciata TaxID=100452 RepID=A0A8S3ZLT6_9EUPU|nr:unnamed protein product [Candidula unifasciata]
MAENISYTEQFSNETSLDTSYADLPLCELEDNEELINYNITNQTLVIPLYEHVLPYVLLVCYLLICALGVTGNGLVIYVVLMFAKMKTVTNMYILNLALSDFLFLMILPIMGTTALVKHWLFGLAMCKIYFVLYSINLFGGAFNLCVMSADRYLAVCHPIRSLRYRTPRVALFLCLCIWSLAFLVMLPIILYSTTVKHRFLPGKETCGIFWPEDQIIPADKAFIWYSFILGFAIPVSLISVFYVLVIFRLRQVGPAKKSKEKRRSHRRVTRLVLTVIAVYVVCWLPYWCFQAYIVFNDINVKDAILVLVFNGFTVLSFANSTLNPFLYAFLSDNFRKSFMKAFKCVSWSSMEASKSICNETSVFQRTSQTYTRSGTSAVTEERMELSAIDNNTNNAVDATNEVEVNLTTFAQDDKGYLMPPVQL